MIQKPPTLIFKSDKLVNKFNQVVGFSYAEPRRISRQFFFFFFFLTRDREMGYYRSLILGVIDLLLIQCQLYFSANTLMY